MPDVDIREEGVVYKQGLAKRLPGRIHRVGTKYQMGCLELSVLVHKNF